MYIALSTHIGHQFWKSTEFKKKLSTKCSSSLILRDSADFMYRLVGRGPEVVESGVGLKISRLVVEISRKNSENLNILDNFHVMEPRKET